VLFNFSEKYNISYPLLSDKNSEVIKSFGILNPAGKPNSRSYGIPHPGFYIIDSSLTVVSKQFEELYSARPSAATILSAHLNQELNGHTVNIKTSYLEGQIVLSDSTGYPSQILLAKITIKMKDGFHLYGRPIAEGYIPLNIEFDSHKDFEIDKIAFPKTTPFTLPGLEETFNVLPQLITLKTYVRLIKKPQLGKTDVSGTISFQACDNKMCFPPEKINFSFPLDISKKI
jgi:hypothetical protein